MTGIASNTLKSRFSAAAAGLADQYVAPPPTTPMVFYKYPADGWSAHADCALGTNTAIT